MSSAIDPDSGKKAARPTAPKNPTAAAGGPKPVPPSAAAKPATSAKAPPPPKAAAKQPAPADKQSAAAQADEADDHAPVASSGFLKQTPAWAISMLVHIVALLGMALIVTDPPEQKKATQITAGVAEADAELNEFQDDLDAQVTPVDTVSAEDVVTPEVAVTTVEVTTNANDVEAAPAAIEVTADFSNIGAVASNMTTSIGGSGKGGGISGRKNAGKLAAAGGGGKDTEEAVDRALRWIAEHQMPDGGWSFELTKCPSCQGKCSHGGEGGHSKDRCGATALALLPFLGKGYTHREGPYKPQIERGISFLAALALKGKGYAGGAGGGNMYSQGLAGIALSECYAMSQDGRLAAPTQAALNFIMTAQDPVGGGWRYSPKQPGDTSAVGWQIMALKSGNMAYLQVNPLTIKKAVEFLDSVQEDDGAFYGYTTPAKKASTSAVGLLCRMYLGWKKDHPALQRGVEFLAKTGPNKDLYYDYYATQIMHHMEGDMWIAWNDKMKGMLLKLQSNNDHEAGSWADGFGGHGPGRLYHTALATMILEVYYRHLPIYRNQVVEEEFKE
jgi:hypothetical protein